MTDGLLCVLSEPGTVPEAEFHEWYDGEHVPLRTALDGVHSARRLRAADGLAPGWAAIYDIDVEVLARPEYAVLRERRSAREQAVVDRLATLDRRSYALVTDDGVAEAAPAVVVMTSLSVPAGLEPELEAWYAEEHVPMLLAVPGWARYAPLPAAGRRRTPVARTARAHRRRCARYRGLPPRGQYPAACPADDRRHGARAARLAYPPGLLNGPGLTSRTCPCHGLFVRRTSVRLTNTVGR